MCHSSNRQISRGNPPQNHASPSCRPGDEAYPRAERGRASAPIAILGAHRLSDFQHAILGYKSSRLGGDNLEWGQIHQHDDDHGVACRARRWVRRDY